MNSKKGISLIVLVITIIVIIILAGAVILNVTKNNPMDSAKIAKVLQEREAVEGAVTLYVGAKTAATTGDYTTTEILSGVADNENLNGVVGAAEVTDIYDASGAKIVGKLYPIDETKSKSELDLSLPKSNGGKWLVDVNSSKIYLQYNSIADAPSYMKENDKIVNTTLLQFLVFTTQPTAE